MAKAPTDTGFRKYLQIFMGLAALGWIDALYSLWHREGMLVEGLAQKSFCNVSSAFNCDAVALSSYSAIGGIPTAALGMFFYATVFVVAVQAYFAASDGRVKEATQASAILFAVSIFTLVPTAIFAFISLAVIKTLCLMCFLTYLANLLLAFFAWKAWGSRTERSGLNVLFSPFPKKAVVTALVLAVIHAIAPAMARSAIGDGGINDAFIETVVAKHLQETPRALRTEGFPSRGPKDAPITIVEFSDYQCPHCARAAMTMPEILRGYGDRVRLVHKDYPLNNECNPKMTGPAHPMACLAAKTGRCVFLKKGDAAFFVYSETLFANQQKLSDAYIKETAATQGVSGAELDTCLADFSTQQTIVEEAQEGTAAGVQGTPAIYVNGRLVEYGVSPRVLKRVLDIYTTK